MKRRSFRVLLATGLGLLIVPLFNLLTVPAPKDGPCCGPERLFNMDFLLKSLSLGLYRLGISVDPALAVVGRDGWVFLGDRHDRAVSDHRASGGAADVRQGREFAQGAQRWASYLQRHGVRHFQIMVAPTKASIYPDQLPGWAAPGRPGLTDALFEGIGEPWFLDLRPALREARKADPAPVFYRYDTHWNAWGGAVAFRAFSQRMGATDPTLIWPAEAHHRSPTPGKREGGDLADFLRLGLAVSDDDPQPHFAGLPGQPGHTLYGDNTPVDPDKVMNARLELRRPLHTRNPGALNPRRVLWLSDSFGGALSPWMHASFTEVVRLHWKDALRDGGTLVRLVDEWKPDMVVVTVVEHAFRGPAFAGFLGYAPPVVPPEGPASGPAMALQVIATQDLAPASTDKGFQITGESPSLTLRAPQPIDARAPLTLVLTCLDGAASLPVQLYWKSAKEPRFHRDRSLAMLHVGATTRFALRRAADGAVPVSANEVRVTLRGHGFCERFRLDGLSAAAAADSGGAAPAR